MATHTATSPITEVTRTETVATNVDRRANKGRKQTKTVATTRGTGHRCHGRYKQNPNCRWPEFEDLKPGDQPN